MFRSYLPPVACDHLNTACLAAGEINLLVARCQSKQNPHTIFRNTLKVLIQYLEEAHLLNFTVANHHQLNKQLKIGCLPPILNEATSMLVHAVKYTYAKDACSNEEPVSFFPPIVFYILCMLLLSEEDDKYYVKESDKLATTHTRIGRRPTQDANTEGVLTLFNKYYERYAALLIDDVQFTERLSNCSVSVEDTVSPELITDETFTSNIGPEIDLFLSTPALASQSPREQHPREKKSGQQILFYHEQTQRRKFGYNVDGTLGGMYTEKNPPKGKKFKGYLKGCIGIVWETIDDAAGSGFDGSVSSNNSYNACDIGPRATDLHALKRTLVAALEKMHECLRAVIDEELGDEAISALQL